MRNLTVNECFEVNGGYQPNAADPIMVSGAFSLVFGVAGATVGVATYLATAAKNGVIFSAIVATQGGIPIISFPISLFAGFGFGVCVGGVVGLGLYYTGIITKLETQ